MDCKMNRFALTLLLLLPGSGTVLTGCFSTRQVSVEELKVLPHSVAVQLHTRQGTQIRTIVSPTSIQGEVLRQQEPAGGESVQRFAVLVLR